MKLRHSALLFLMLCGLLAFPASAVRAEEFELHDGDRVIFLGNTLIEREQKYGYWETMLTARWPERDIKFRNLGWSGDTVWAESRGIFDPPEKGYQRMLEHVGRIKPTVIFVGYGNVEAFAGEEGLPAFVKQYNKLLDDLTKVSAEGVRFVLIAPVKQIEFGPPRPSSAKYNTAVEQYAAAIESITEARGLSFVDFNEWIETANSGRTANAGGAFKYDPEFWTSDGVTWNGGAYETFGETLAEMLFGKTESGDVIVKGNGTIESANSVKAEAEKLADRLRIEIALLRIPLYEVNFFARDLPEGVWELRRNDKVLARGNHSTWRIATRLDFTEGFDTVDPLRQAIIEKNLLYFYHWRPQNITYLTGFRKHEQGQNAEETAEFEKLVAEKEARIAKLRQPTPHTYELVRVKESEGK